MHIQNFKSAAEKMAAATTIADFLEPWLGQNFLLQPQQQVFDHYYRSYIRSFGPYIKRAYSAQTKELLKRAKTLENPRVLEIGSGCGTEVLWLAANGIATWGIDIDNEALAVARGRKELLELHWGRILPATFINKSVLDMEATDTFDIIFLEQAFHHLEPRRQVVDTIARAVASGGYVVISEVNFWNPLNQLVMFRHRGFKTIGEYQGHPVGNERLITAYGLQRNFSRRGFRKTSLSYYRVLPNGPFTDNLAFIDRLIPAWFRPAFTHYNLVMQKT